MVLRADLAQLAATAAVALRFSVMAATLPMLGQRNVPFLWRLGLAGALAAAVGPLVAAHADLSGFRPTWPVLVAEASRSLLVGALLSFTVGFVFTVVRYAGHIVGMQIGYAIVNVVDPQSGANVSVIAQVYYLLATLLFFAIDGHHLVMAGLVESCLVLPLFAEVDLAAGTWQLVRQYCTLFQLGLQIAAPVVIVLLLVSATMGVVVKTVPQINILIVGFPIKIAVGLIAFGFSLTYFQTVFVSLMADLQQQIADLLGALG